MNKLTAYWITFAHIPKWGNIKKNNIIAKFYLDMKLTIDEFFNLPDSVLQSDFDFDYVDIDLMIKARSELAINSFLAEILYNDGYEVIPINSPEYSTALKKNLKMTYAPPVIYTKGNKELLNGKSIAIVGSRDASDIALTFTDNIAKQASNEGKIIVSGYAKGVDKQALDSAINYKGQSIIVLPQGIMTFNNGYKMYYKQIIGGDVLIVSVFHPKSPWKTELAMARNPIIYGLADEIYVAESSDKGGTWNGVVDGLRKKRDIYVRFPDINENNANLLLIKNGAIPVDILGHLMKDEVKAANDEKEELHNRIKNILAESPLSSSQIVKLLKSDLSALKMSNYLKNLDFIKVINSKPIRFTLKDTQAPNSMF